MPVSFFRSEKMTLCQMLLHKESAFDCVAELGKLGLVQFNNLSDPDHIASLRFTNEVQRCNELQRILHHLETEIEEFEIKIVYYPDVDEDLPKARDLHEIELELQEVDQELSGVEKHFEALMHKQSLLKEKWYVLTKVSEFLHGDRNTESMMAWSDSVVMKLLRDETANDPEKDTHQKVDHVKLGFFTGSIPIDRFRSFETMLWRVCRGNFFMRHGEIEVPLLDVHHTNGMVRKYAFIVFFQGEAMRGKISKICQGFRITLYQCPESYEERLEKRNEVTSELEDMKIVVTRTDEHRRRILLIAAADFYIWKTKVKKMLMIYFTLNKLSHVEQVDNQKYLQAECWIPTADIPKVRYALQRGARLAAKGDGNMMFPPILTEKPKEKREPPTHFRVNRFTRGFQNLIDSYGIATYQELNPAPYTIVTFPFLFAVMFGDIGHGILMSIFGIWMVKNEVKLEEKRVMQIKQNEIWNILFAGRYIIMMMGLFSIYTGFIYNDMFSKAFNLFGSKWRVSFMESEVQENHELPLDPRQEEFYIGKPYIFGVDPVWDASGENSIVTFNSLKMKLAIVLGVTQMVFGLALSAFNNNYLKNKADLWLVCVPQLVFLLCLFVYLVFLIFYKWAVYGGHYENPYNSACAPSILITFIDMILMKGGSKVPEGCEKFIYDGQDSFQAFLLTIALLCIPILLAGKPLLFMYQQRKIRSVKDKSKQIELRRSTLEHVRKSLVYNVDLPSGTEIDAPTAQDEKELEQDLGELWIHQGIHCIESVLGSVSHTASYLRLWALSLAHDQLSTVLWNMVLAPALKSNGFGYSVMLYCCFTFWAILTLAILVVMEGLSAFLHTLRLHWVEFQSKFYAGAGELFMPFRFEKTTPSD